MSSFATCGLLLKQSFDDWTGRLRRMFPWVPPRILMVGAARRSARWTRRANGAARDFGRVGRFAPLHTWPARHPAEMAMLQRRSRAHDHRAQCVDT